MHGEQALEELAAIATEKAFTETASADMYVPALMQNLFPYLDNRTLYVFKRDIEEAIDDIESQIGVRIDKAVVTVPSQGRKLKIVSGHPMVKFNLKVME